MSEINLHGYPVNAGDKVWSAIYQQYGRFIRFNDSGKHNGTAFHPGYEIEVAGFVVLHSETILFWNPIGQSAIDAAKVKKEPVYEYRWYISSADRLHDNWMPKRSVNNPSFICIEESKREVKP